MHTRYAQTGARLCAVTSIRVSMLSKTATEAVFTSETLQTVEPFRGGVELRRRQSPISVAPNLKLAQRLRIFRFPDKTAATTAPCTRVTRACIMRSNCPFMGSRWSTAIPTIACSS